MIVVKNRVMLVPLDERYIGTTYDTESENRQFQIRRFAQNGVDLSALTFRLDLKYANGSTDTVVLEKEIADYTITLTWEITTSQMQVPGTLFIQMRAVDDEATVKWSSFEAAMYVSRHINTPGSYTGDLTEIEQMEQDHQYMLSVVDELKANLDYSHDAEAWAAGTRSGTAVESTDDAYQNNSKYYRQQSERYAKGTEDGTAVGSGVGYHDNAKYYSEQSDGYSNISEAYAKGTVDGVAVGSGATGYQDNAKYYKEQAAATVADTNTRFDNAVAAVTTDTEVTDIRVGADGVTYGTAGTAVRTQFSDLKSQLKESSLIVDVDFENGNYDCILRGYYVAATGKSTASTAWKTVLMKIPPHLRMIEGAFGASTLTLLCIAFYSSNSCNENSFISGVAVEQNGKTHSVIVPDGAVTAIITSRPASYAGYWAKLYFDYSDAIIDNSEAAETLNVGNGFDQYTMFGGYYNSSNSNVVTASTSISTNKIKTNGAKTIYVKCPGYKFTLYKFADYTSNAVAVLTNVSNDYFNPGDVDGASYFAVSVGRTDSANLTDSDKADIKSKLSIVLSTKPYTDQKEAYEQTIIGMNEDREQLFSNFKWPINLGNGGAIANANKMLCLLHFSDIHNDGTNLQRVMDYYNGHSSMIDDVLFTGDYMNDNFNNSMAFWTGVEGSEKILGVIGNHDATNTSDHYATNVSQQDMFEKFFYGIASWGCVYQTNKTWWYKDYTTQGIRLIGLNSSLDSTYAAEQLTWLEGVLADAKTNDLDVCIAIHFPVLGSKINSNFTTLDYNAPSLVSHCVSADIIDAVDDFIEDGGKFICYLTGHTHIDYMLTANARNTQVAAVVTTGKNENGGFYGDQARKEYTRSNDAFNLVSIDKISHTVKFIRIGANCDHYVRPRNTLAINYLTGEVITET